jgi:hypothetical protein
MAFSEEGFLSASLVDWRAATREQFKDWFEFVDKLNLQAMRLLPTIEPDRTKKHEVVAALLYRRALQSFQGSVLMAERGMNADALTLVRSCAETAIAIGGVLADEKFVASLMEADAKHRLTYANVILADDELRQGLSSEWVTNLQQVVSAAKNKYPAPGPRGINWAQVAKHAKMSNLYDMLYRITSGGAAHVTINALDRHVEPNDDGSIGNLTFRPETRDLVLSLSVGVCALLHAMEALGRLFPQEELRQTIESYTKSWAALESTTQRDPVSITPSIVKAWTASSA